MDNLYVFARTLPSVILTSARTIGLRICAYPISAALTAIGIIATAFFLKRQLDASALRERVQILKSLGKLEYEESLTQAGVAPKDTAKIISVYESIRPLLSENKLPSGDPETLSNIQTPSPIFPTVIDLIAKVSPSERNEIIRYFQDLYSMDNLPDNPITYISDIMKLPRKERPEVIEVLKILTHLPPKSKNSPNTQRRLYWNNSITIDNIKKCPRGERENLAKLAKELAESDPNNSDPRITPCNFVLLTKLGRKREEVLALTKALVSKEKSAYEFTRTLEEIYSISRDRTEIVESVKTIANLNSKEIYKLVFAVGRLVGSDRNEIVNLAQKIFTPTMENNERARIISQLSHIQSDVKRNALFTQLSIYVQAQQKKGIPIPPMGILNWMLGYTNQSL